MYTVGNSHTRYPAISEVRLIASGVNPTNPNEMRTSRCCSSASGVSGKSGYVHSIVGYTSPLIGNPIML